MPPSHGLRFGVTFICTYCLKEAKMKIAMFAHFKEYHQKSLKKKKKKKIKSLYDFGGRCLKN